MLGNIDAPCMSDCEAWFWPLVQHESMAKANALASSYLPPFLPSVPTKSVSQNWQIATDLSRS
jgi:hypothetical protein